MSSLSSPPSNGNTIITSDCCDRISMLPDEILSSILSFLPTNQAVSTSVLSKRWEFLWTYVCNINFDDKLFNEKYRYMVHSFVYKVLKELKVKRIRTFSLNGIFNELDLTAWIRDAIKLKVEQLRLHSVATYSGSITLPKDLFTSAATLVELKLSGDFALSNLSPRVCLPNLKRLSLVTVDNWDDERGSRLIEACLALEKLYINISSWYSEWEVCSITSSSLTHLELVFRDHIFRDHRGNDQQIKKVKINVPNLRYIYIRNNEESKELSVLCRLSSLIEANVDICNVDIPEKNFGREILPRFLEHFNNVKTFTISSSILKALSFSPIGTFVIFQNITHLTLKAELCNWNLLSYILERSTNLQVLRFSKGIHSPKEIPERCWYEPRHVPKCLDSSLRRISIRGYQGLNDELQMVKYFLENAQVLERMEIGSALGETLRSRLYQKIQMINRVDKTCEIVFLS